LFVFRSSSLAARHDRRQLTALLSPVFLLANGAFNKGIEYAGTGARLMEIFYRTPMVDEPAGKLTTYLLTRG